MESDEATGMTLVVNSKRAWWHCEGFAQNLDCLRNKNILEEGHFLKPISEAVQRPIDVIWEYSNTAIVVYLECRGFLQSRVDAGS